MGPQILDATRALQTVIAPVFLILGAGTLLASMAARYGRIIDRAICGMIQFAKVLPFVVPDLFSLSLLLLIVALVFFMEDFAISLRVFEAQMAAKRASAPSRTRASPTG